MGLRKVTRESLNEGPLDFLRGASKEAGNKLANTGIARATRDVMAAGRAASDQGNFNKLVAQLAKQIARYDALKSSVGDADQEAPTPQPAAQQQPAVAPAQQPAAQAPAQVNTRTKRKAAPQPAPQPVVPESFSFGTYMRAVSADQLDEGMWDFVKGASAAAADKMRAYAQNKIQNSTLAQLYHAGKQASASADAVKASQELQRVKAETAATLKMVVDHLQKQGQNAQTALSTALAQIPDKAVQARVQALVTKHLQPSA